MFPLVAFVPRFPPCPVLAIEVSAVRNFAPSAYLARPVEWVVVVPLVASENLPRQPPPAPNIAVNATVRGNSSRAFVFLLFAAHVALPPAFGVRRLNSTLHPSPLLSPLSSSYGMQRYFSPLQSCRQSHARQMFPPSRGFASLFSTAKYPGGASLGSSRGSALSANSINCISVSRCRTRRCASRRNLLRFPANPRHRLRVHAQVAVPNQKIFVAGD